MTCRCNGLGQTASDGSDAAQPPAPVAQPGLFDFVPSWFQSFEQARVYNAATNAQVSQMNQLANVNPIWLLAGLAVVIIAIARR